MAIFGSGLPSPRAGLLAALPLFGILLVACTDGTTPYCGPDAGCGYPLIEASLTDGQVLDGGDAAKADAAASDAGGDSSDASVTDASSSDASSSDAPSSDASSADAPVDSTTQG